MHSKTRRIAANALASLPLAIFVLLCIWSDYGSTEEPPRAAIDAATSATSPDDPSKVIVGAYTNDIQELDFKTNSYAVDLYVWFRWKPTDPSVDPSKSMEFMNRYEPDDHLRTELYEQPKPMPDGTVYSIIRNQGRFSAKFPLEHYPFDTQSLAVEMEDTVSGADKQVYVPDPKGAVTINPDITLPGFRVGKPVMHITAKAYPTDFGDLTEADAVPYSRVMLSVPVTRPILAMTIKTFVPIALIVACAALVFFVRPHYVEGRMGLGITALLTLVALQLTSGASLPEVDYLMMLDKIYLLAYFFIIISLAHVVATSWRSADPKAEASISRGDRIWVSVLLGSYILANIVIFASTLHAL